MKERALSTIKKAASEFINLESNRSSLITVTNVMLDNRGSRVEVHISVYPEKDTRAAVEFLNRKRDDFRAFLKKNTRLKALPRPLFLADPVIGGTIEEVETED